MAMNPEFHVPGAYTFDNPPPFPAPRSTSPPSQQSFGADVFRPPGASPSPSGSAVLPMAKSASSSLFSDVSMAATPAAGTATPAANAKRKRPATDSREGTPLPSDWGHMSLETDGGGAGDSKVVYTLAGQIDNSTPGAQGARLLHGLDDSVYAYTDLDYRRALGPGTGALPAAAAASSSSASAAEGGRGADADRWTVLHALGSVVGKVWEFCTTGAFRGFHAGGGAGYDWETGQPTAAGTGSSGGSGNSGSSGGSSISGEAKAEAGGGPEWPAPSEDQRPARSATPTTPTQHVGKRRHVGSAGDELARSWVMVQQPDPRSARRSTTGATAASAAKARPKATTTAARALPSSSSSSSRRSAGAPSRRISTPVTRLGTGTSTGTGTGTGTGGGLPRTTAPNSRLRVSHAGSPGLQPREPASFASPRSPRSPAVAASTLRSPPATSVRSPVAAAAASPRRAARAATLFGRPQSPFSRGGSPAAAGGRTTTPRAQHGASSAGTANNPFARTGVTSPRAGGRTHQRSQSSIGSMGGGSGPRGMAALAAAKGYDDAALAASPRLTDEAKQLAAQQRAADADADEKMEAFNRRLQEMIRQGQEALGTRFEVDEGGDGAGRRDAGFWTDE